MNKIDISSWKDFTIGDIFEVKSPISRVQTDYVEGSVPFVASGNFNNGIQCYCSPKEKEELDKGNCISVSPVDGYAFYQENDFLGRGGAGSSIILLYNENLNKYNSLFICTIIRKICRDYKYNNMGNKNKIKSTKIYLPCDKNENPDWIYMEEYIKSEIVRSEKNYKLINKIHDTKKHLIDTTKWKNFKIGDLFSNIVLPKVYHTKDVHQSEEGIPYVVRTKFNNGVKYLVSKDDDMILNPAGVISFGAENSTFFYQEKEYVSGRDMYYIDTRNISKECALFLITCLEKITSGYSYNYGLFPSLLKDEEIKLPVDQNGQPNWLYMENYIKHLYSNL